MNRLLVSGEQGLQGVEMMVVEYEVLLQLFDIADDRKILSKGYL